MEGESRGGEKDGLDQKLLEVKRGSERKSEERRWRCDGECGQAPHEIQRGETCGWGNRGEAVIDRGCWTVSNCKVLWAAHSLKNTYQKDLIWKIWSLSHCAEKRFHWSGLLTDPTPTLPSFSFILSSWKDEVSLPVFFSCKLLLLWCSGRPCCPVIRRSRINQTWQLNTVPFLQTAVMRSFYSYEGKNMKLSIITHQRLNTIWSLDWFWFTNKCV